MAKYKFKTGINKIEADKQKKSMKWRVGSSLRKFIGSFLRKINKTDETLGNFA